MTQRKVTVIPVLPMSSATGKAAINCCLEHVLGYAKKFHPIPPAPIFCQRFICLSNLHDCKACRSLGCHLAIVGICAVQMQSKCGRRAGIQEIELDMCVKGTLIVRQQPFQLFKVDQTREPQSCRPILFLLQR